MRKIINIAIHEVRVMLANPAAFIVQVFVVPVIFIAFIGSVISDERGSPIIRLDVIDNDGGSLASRFIESLQANDALIVCPYANDMVDDEEDADPCRLGDDVFSAALSDTRIEDGTIFGALVIPAGFSEGLHAGEGQALAFRSNPDLEGSLVLQQQIDPALSRVSGSISVARIGVEAGEAIAPFEDDAARDAYFDALYQAAEAAWSPPPIDVQVEGTGALSGTGFGQSAAGMGAMYVMFVVLAATPTLLEEREQGVLQRLIVLPLSRSGVLAGKMLAYFVMGVVEFIFMIIVGLFFGVDWGTEYLAIILLAAAFSLAMTAVALFLAAIVRTSAQAQGVTLLVTMSFAPLGGAWWSLSLPFIPNEMNIIGHLTPVAWVMDGFTALIFEDGTLATVLPFIAILLGYAVVFMLLGAWRFRYE